MNTLEKVIDLNSHDENLVDVFHDAYMDDDWGSEEINNLYLEYLEAQSPDYVDQGDAATIDRVMTALCGWTMKTLAEYCVENIENE